MPALTKFTHEIHTLAQANRCMQLAHAARICPVCSCATSSHFGRIRDIATHPADRTTPLTAAEAHVLMMTDRQYQAQFTRLVNFNRLVINFLIN